MGEHFVLFNWNGPIVVVNHHVCVDNPPVQEASRYYSSSGLIFRVRD